MSDSVATPEKKEDVSNPAESQAPAEKPFNVDVLTTCTARFTREAWDLFLSFQKENLDFMRTSPLRVTLTARSGEGAKEIHQTLMKEKGVTEIKLSGAVITATATFEDIQAVIKHPQTLLCDAQNAI